MANVVLIGYRGSGKTTVGRLLAERLGYAFVDTDALVAQRAGKSIATIFAEEGETAFRIMEAEVIGQASTRNRLVLSVGGGAVIREDNGQRLRALGTVFWLAADAETLWARVRGDATSAEGRPALTDHAGLDEVSHVLAQRERLYRQCAHHRIDVAYHTPAQVAQVIEAVLGKADPTNTATSTPRPLRRRTFHPMTWLGRHELATLILVLLVVAGVWAFAELADEVLEGETRWFDETVLLALRSPQDRSDPWGPEWLEEMGRDCTAVGGMVVLTFLTLAVAGFLALQGKRRTALLVLVSVGGGVLLSLLLKHSFERPRPDLVPHGSYALTTSFPSGHSMLSAATYLTLGALLARVQSRPAMRAYVLMLAMLLTFGVGASRVYMGVHWPTDVLAGWTAGTTWALLCWLAARWLQRRGKVEADVPDPMPCRP